MQDFLNHIDTTLDKTLLVIWAAFLTAQIWICIQVIASNLGGRPARGDIWPGTIAFIAGVILLWVNY